MICKTLHFLELIYEIQMISDVLTFHSSKNIDFEVFLYFHYKNPDMIMLNLSTD